MSRVLTRLNGGGTAGVFAGGDRFTAERITPARMNATRDYLDLLGLGGIGNRNVLAGGDVASLGLDGSVSGDIDLLNWTPFVVDNTALQLSSFSDVIGGATLVVQIRYLLRVSNAGLSLTPKILYGSTITTITTVATISGQTACVATATDFSGANQYQTVTVTLPSGVNIFKPQVTRGGTPAAGYQGFARAWWDCFIQS